MDRLTDTGLTIRRVALTELHADPANARAHDEVNLAAIEGSLARFQQVEPLVVQAGTRRVIGGNGRLVAMRKLGWTHADVVELEIDDLQATALGIALNRTGELAAWDDPALARILEQLREADALDGVGFDDKEIDKLLRSIEQATELTDPGPEEPPEHPVTRRGDLWVLGEHRILCGDSTSAEDMARLMAGETAVLLATDPPYLVDYDGTNHPAEHHKKAGRTAAEGKEVGNKHWDAYIDPASSVEFFAAYLRVASGHCIERVPIYQWHATRRQALIEQAWEMNDLLVHQTIIWTKSRGVLTRSHYLWQHEPCFYGWRKGMQPEKDRRPPTTSTTVWEIGQQGDTEWEHPTRKPVEIFTRPIECHTFAGEVILEPFSGSGTQIIGAEKLRRRCRAMELSPAFVDVAVKRWQSATGGTATLEDGRSWSEVAAERARTDPREPGSDPATTSRSDPDQEQPDGS